MGSVRSVDRTAAPGVPLDGLLERIAARAPRGRGPVLRTFAEAYVRRLPSAELALRADDLPGEVRGAFALADGRGNAEVAVRAFNPTTADDGYETPGSVLETNTPDSPFLFDSVNEELQARGLAVTRVVHPVIGTERDAKGRLTALPHVREAATRESVMHFEVDRRLGAEELADLETRIRSILGDVRLTVRDFEPMRERIVHMIEIARDGARRYPADAVDETVAFLRWLLDLNFVFLGYREYDLVEATGGGNTHPDLLRAAEALIADGRPVALAPRGSPRSRPSPDLARFRRITLVSGFGSVFVTYFLEGPVENYTDLLANDVDMFIGVRREQMKHGVFELPLNLKRSHFSYAHTDDDVDRLLEAAEASAKAVLEARA